MNDANEKNAALDLLLEIGSSAEAGQWHEFKSLLDEYNRQPDIARMRAMCEAIAVFVGLVLIALEERRLPPRPRDLSFSRAVMYAITDSMSEEPQHAELDARILGPIAALLENPPEAACNEASYSLCEAIEEWKAKFSKSPSGRKKNYDWTPEQFAARRDELQLTEMSDVAIQKQISEESGAGKQAVYDNFQMAKMLRELKQYWLLPRDFQ